MVSDAETLARLRRVSRLGSEHIERMIREASSSSVKAHGVIYNQSSASAGVLMVLNGAARLTGLSRHGTLITLVGPGDIFVHPSSQSAINFRLEALTDCTVAQISAEDFARKILNIPADTFTVAAEIAAGIFLDIASRYANWGTLRVRERLISLLVDLASKFGVEDSRGVILGPRFTHRDLAELVGASRPKVTAALTQLAVEQAVIRDGRRLILVPERLRNLLGAEETASRALARD